MNNKLLIIIAAATLAIVGGCAKGDDILPFMSAELSTVPNPPAFAAPVKNPFGLADVGYKASPTFVDIDNDGDLDAFIGEQAGNIIYFENTGTVFAPVFAAKVTNPFGLNNIGGNAAPAFADIDSDGDLDVFVGGMNGNTMYFANTGSASAPAFALVVTNPFKLANVGIRATPVFVDIDNDGDLDAFIGNSDGNTIYFANIDSFPVPIFDSAITNLSGLSDVGDDASPTFADIDNDSDLDMFVGEWGGNMMYFENTASTPVFAAPAKNPFGLVDIGWNVVPTFIDIDNDGDLDAFVGDYYGSIMYFENTQL